MSDKPLIRIGHLKITDHLILGITKDKLKKKKETFTHCLLETVLMTEWQQVADALSDGSIDGAFILAPAAMDLYKSGINIKLLLFAHKSGSIIIKNKAAKINKLEDFKDKIVLIPYKLSIHHILFFHLLSGIGLRPGISSDPDADVILEVMAPNMMPEAIQYDQNGEIGGFIVAEPIGSQAVAEGFGEVLCLSKNLWPKHPCCVFVMRDEIIKSNIDAIYEITQSLVNSGNFIETYPEQAAFIGSEFLSQDINVIKNVLTDPSDRVLTGELFPVIEDLAVIQNYMCDNMHIMKNKIDMEAFVDTRFAKASGAK